MGTLLKDTEHRCRFAARQPGLASTGGLVRDCSGDACDYTTNLNDRAEFLGEDHAYSDTLHEARKPGLGTHAEDEPTLA